MYTQIFSATGETAAIDRTERRYAWLRKRLRAREDVWAVFPEAWRVQQHVCLLFCKVGRLASVGCFMGCSCMEFAADGELDDGAAKHLRERDREIGCLKLSADQDPDNDALCSADSKHLQEQVSVSAHCEAPVRLEALA